MAKTKRTKKYKPGRVRLPMMEETRNSLALELRLAVSALVAAPSIDTYNQLNQMLAAVAHAAEGDADIRRVALSLDLALRQVAERFERLETVTVTALEATTLHAGIDLLDGLLGHLCMYRFREAVARVGVESWLIEHGMGGG